MPQQAQSPFFLTARLSMYLCYIDESGTPEVPGNTSHFVLCGIAIPIWHWQDVEREITNGLQPYGLADVEFHTAWLIRPYLEQKRVKDFASLTWTERRAQALVERNRYLLKLQKANNHKLLKQTKKNFKHTEPYLHLTFEERKAALRKVAECIAKWGFARVFAECIDKLWFDAAKTGRQIDEQAFEQVVSRFEQWIARQKPPSVEHQNFGLLIHDMNPTVAEKHSRMMRDFFQKGTLWTRINHIVETPFFVNSRLTRMVQMADVCAWALRRYLENGEKELFSIIQPRADRWLGKVVGMRHYTNHTCKCQVCAEHT
jgi:hypothetical protein